MTVCLKELLQSDCLCEGALTDDCLCDGAVTE